MKNILKPVLNFCRKNAPTILTIIGCTGVISTAICSAKDTIKADEKVDEYICFNEEIKDKKSLVKACWKCYIPTAISASVSIGSMIVANRIDIRRISALSASAGLSSALATKWRKSVKDIYGDEGVDKVVKNIAEMETESGELIEIANQKSALWDDKYGIEYHGNAGDKVKILDIYTNTIFYATPMQVQEAMYNLNRDFTFSGYAELATFYRYLGIELSQKYDYMGWHIDEQVMGYETFWIDIRMFWHESEEMYDLEYIQTPYPIYDFDGSGGYPLDG